MSPRILFPILLVLIVGGLLVGALAGVAAVTLFTVVGLIAIVAGAFWIFRKTSSSRRP